MNPGCTFGVVLAPTDVPQSAEKTRFDTLGKIGTKLVTDRAQPTVFTTHQETDSRVALSRAVAEYLAPMEVRDLARPVRFETVVYEWAVQDIKATYPALGVYATGAQEYDANGFTPSIGISRPIALPQDDYLIHTSNLTVRLTVQVYASDPEERMALVAGLERACSPVRFMSGFRLDMPHYFGARAEFLKKSLTYEDSAEDSQRRWRRATVILEARGPVYRVEKIRRATIKPDVQVSQGA